MRAWLEGIGQYAEKQNYPYKGYGLFQSISNPVFFFMWLLVGQQTYDNVWIRLSVSLICLPLLFIDHWPVRVQKFIPFYWYFTLSYTLVFFFTFMLLKNDLGFMWSLNALSGVVL